MPSTVQHLTEEEKARCRYHMGYPMTTFGNEQAAASLEFGVGVPHQTTFLVEHAIGTLLTNPYSLDRVRKLLDVLDRIEGQLLCELGRLGVAKIGEIELRGAKSGETSTDMLEREYRRWQRRLADAVGAPLYPYSERTRGRSRTLSVSG